MQLRERLFKMVGGLVVLFSFGFGWVYMDYDSAMQGPLTVSEEGFQFEISPGSSLSRVARVLHEEGVLENPKYFTWMARLRDQAEKVHVGEYQITPGMTPEQLLNNMVEGKVKQYALTIVEGWTFAELLNKLHQDPVLKHHLNEKSQMEIMAAIGHAGEHPEGRFLPDTYHFPKGLSDVDFLKRAYSAMDKSLQAAWQKRSGALPYASPYEALIMASIVEKETALPSEREEIAGVFVRRLEKNMRLQTDPTIIYGLGSSFDGNLKRKHLQDKENPYNTYRHKGLPPTPIALPGVEAIHAALNPKEGETLYFVARQDEQGSHYFSSTLDEHNKAVVKYQLNGRAKPFSSMPKVNK